MVHEQSKTLYRLSNIFLAPTIADYFAELANQQATNITTTPSHEEFETFFNPSYLSGSGCHAKYPNGITHVSILFHEALHGYYGLGDKALEIIFNRVDDLVVVDDTDTGKNSGTITDYIAHHIFGWPGNLKGISDLCDQPPPGP